MELYIIRKKRIATAKTMREVAMDTGIPVNVLSSIETRKQPATWDYLQKLALYYGCSISDLI